MALWSAAGISFLASGIGKPLFVDNRTEQMAMVAFARVCVEIDASNSLPEVVEFMMKGELRTVTVQYEWIPALCPSCSTFGHKCPVPTEAGPSKVGPPLPRSHGPPQNEWREVRNRRNKNIPDAQGLNSTRIAPLPPQPGGDQQGLPMPQKFLASDTQPITRRQEEASPSIDPVLRTSPDPAPSALLQI